MNKGTLNKIEKAINNLSSDYYTKKDYPPMIYPIILKFHGAEMILSQTMTQTIFDGMQKTISDLEIKNINLKMKKGFKERVKILFTGRCND